MKLYGPMKYRIVENPVYTLKDGSQKQLEGTVIEAVNMLFAMSEIEKYVPVVIVNENGTFTSISVSLSGLSADAEIEKIGIDENPTIWNPEISLEFVKEPVPSY